MKKENKIEICECGHGKLQHSCQNADGTFNTENNKPQHLGFCHYCKCRKFNLKK